MDMEVYNPSLTVLNVGTGLEQWVGVCGWFCVGWVDVLNKTVLSVDFYITPKQE